MDHRLFVECPVPLPRPRPHRRGRNRNQWRWLPVALVAAAWLVMVAAIIRAALRP